jgi:hypothetical protein
LKNIWIGILIACCPLTQAFAQDVQGTSATVSVGNVNYVFSCSGVDDAQFISVSLPEGHLGNKRLAAPQHLDDGDNCSQVMWNVQPSLESSARFIMVNPGRLGLNAQMLVYYADRDGVDFSGYLPVAADMSSRDQFRVVGNDAYGQWERTYTFEKHKIGIAQELLLMNSGTVCLEHGGNLKINLPCAGATIKANANKPVCVVYRKGLAKLAALHVCSSLAKQE